MTPALETNLVNVNLVPEGGGPPYSLFAAWRAQDPVHWNPPPPPGTYRPLQPGMDLHKGFWVLTRYKDVSEVSRDAELFTTHMEGMMVFDYEPAALEQQRAGIMCMRPKTHMQVKQIVVPPFMPRSLDAFAPEIARVAQDIVDDVIELGQCEFVFDVASKLPVYTFCKLTGIPDRDREKIFKLGNKAADFETAPDPEGPAKARLLAYSMNLVKEKKASPDKSLMSALVHGQVDGDRLSDEQLGMFFFIISVAGHETTRGTAAHFIRLMNEHRDQYELLLSDIDGHLPNAIEEVLRFAPPVLNFRRTVAKDTVVGGHQFRAGDKIYMSYPAANRDPDVFADPDRFDITRKNANRHLSFGVGPHVCLGARLARLQLFELLKAIITRMPDIRMTAEPAYLRSIIFNAIINMPVEFTSGRRMGN
ncbi:cytochrome P450 [Tardiphaga sp. 215_C5_N2_1]|uniref:cytochrome P450 n=1 Tax=Tardiphaga sp. 215_C5_N2_1 TaxID=3240774 RepID=UPI003F8BAF1E